MLSQKVRAWWPWQSPAAELERATWSVLRRLDGKPDEHRGTAFAVSADGLFLTAGHLFRENNPDVGFYLQKEKRTVQLKTVDWLFDPKAGEDYALCKTVTPVGALDYAALSFPKACRGPVRLRGYGVVGGHGQKDALGAFIGTAERSNGGRIFLFQSEQAGSSGYSGSGIFAAQNGGITAIQTEAAEVPVGPSWNTVFAYPLFRIKKQLTSAATWRTRLSWWLRSTLRAHRTLVIAAAILALVVLPVAAVRLAVTGWFLAAYNDPLIVAADSRETVFWNRPEVLALQAEVAEGRRSHDEVVALMGDDLKGEVLKINTVQEQLTGCVRSGLCEPLIACSQYKRVWDFNHFYAPLWETMRRPPFNQDLVRNQEFFLFKYCPGERTRACEDSNNDSRYCGPT